VGSIVPLQAVLTAPEAARRYRLSHGYVVSLVSRKVIVGRKAEGTWLIDEASLKRYLSQERKPGPKPRKKLN